MLEDLLEGNRSGDIMKHDRFVILNSLAVALAQHVILEEIVHPSEALQLQYFFPSAKLLSITATLPGSEELIATSNLLQPSIVTFDKLPLTKSAAGLTLIGEKPRVFSGKQHGEAGLVDAHHLMTNHGCEAVICAPLPRSSHLAEVFDAQVCGAGSAGYGVANGRGGALGSLVVGVSDSSSHHHRKVVAMLVVFSNLLGPRLHALSLGHTIPQQPVPPPLQLHLPTGSPPSMMPSTSPLPSPPQFLYQQAVPESVPISVAAAVQQLHMPHQLPDFTLQQSMWLAEALNACPNLPEQQQQELQGLSKYLPMLMQGNVVEASPFSRPSSSGIGAGVNRLAGESCGASLSVSAPPLNLGEVASSLASQLSAATAGPLAAAMNSGAPSGHDLSAVGVAPEPSQGQSNPLLDVLLQHLATHLQAKGVGVKQG